MSLASSTIKVGPHPDRLEGVYRNRPGPFAAWAAGVLAVPFIVVALALAPSRSLATYAAAALLIAAALAVAVAVGRHGVRPRLEVSPDGIVVVNAARTQALAWAEIAGFEAGSHLVVRTPDHQELVVDALPTRIWGGPVATLADRLNAQLDAVVLTP